MGSISHGGHERGKRGDGDLTRARILESAGQLAAECGYANMTSKQVCERAHVNMAAVNYHLGKLLLHQRSDVFVLHFFALSF